MTGRILDRLAPLHNDRVADVGCGTGLFTGGLVERVGRVVCVDPSRPMLERLPRGDGYVPVEASAEDVAAGSSTSSTTSPAPARWSARSTASTRPSPGTPLPGTWSCSPNSRRCCQPSRPS
ncbi:class I SAM-dependent methyltransferase [Actinomadura nitritigenes]|uniref:class I SAM-dependent methyltransferase n=1 Tax=Actinomadura nitritigenes TaxID=134602 RepID=UPI003D8A3181